MTWKVGDTGEMRYKVRDGVKRRFTVVKISPHTTEVTVEGSGTFVLEGLIRPDGNWELVSETPEPVVKKLVYRCANCGHSWGEHGNAYDEENSTACWAKKCNCEKWRVKL